MVYDGSAKEKGETYLFNDCLETGPNYIPKLFNILVKFRSPPIAFTSDIEKAFLMIHVAETDRDYLRFLWFEDTFAQPSKLVHHRFTRLVFGLRPSPAILGSVIIHHLERYTDSDPEIARLLQDSFYVDDLVTGAQNVEQAYNLYLRAKQIMADTGMNLRKWSSNSKEEFIVQRVKHH